MGGNGVPRKRGTAASGGRVRVGWWVMRFGRATGVVVAEGAAGWPRVKGYIVIDGGGGLRSDRRWRGYGDRPSEREGIDGVV